MRVLAVIPARLGSTRLPRKALREIAGKPMVGWVYEAAAGSGVLDAGQVVIATDSPEILDVCAQHGWNARLTSASHRSGTERVQEIAESMPADVYFNLQGDEPLARPEHVQALLQVMRDLRVQVGTLKTPCAAEDVTNPNAVKVVTDRHGDALYFSRSTVPYDRDGSAPAYFKHLGFYAYRAEALRHFCTLPESRLERAERLEQLRFLEDGIRIRVAETPFDTVGVDTESDLQRVVPLLAARISA